MKSPTYQMIIRLGMLLGICIGTGILISGCDNLVGLQPVPAKGFIKFYGGVEAQAGTDIQPTADDGFILLGSTSSFGTADSDLFLVKTDSVGNAEWSLVLGGPNPDFGRAVLVTPSVGGYAVVGDYGLNAAGDSTKIYFAKVSATGQLEFERVLRDSVRSLERVQGMELLPDGSGYILMGSTTDVDTTKNGWDPATDFQDIFVIRMGPLATPQITFEQQHGFAGIDEGVAVRPFAEGTYDILGNTTIPGNEHTDIIFSKISEDGIPLISTKVIGGADDDEAVSLVPDGTGYLIAGSSKSNDVKRFFWTRTDDQGNSLMEMFLGGVQDDELASVIALDQGFIIAGTTLSFARSGNVGKDFYVAQVGADGVPVWDRVLGSDDDDMLGKAIPTLRGYVFVGTSGFSNNTNLTLTKINLTGEL